ncbi:hypothetical protein MHYP_G00252290 [Metynnis hypsauchen]
MNLLHGPLSSFPVEPSTSISTFQWSVRLCLSLKSGRHLCLHMASKRHRESGAEKRTEKRQRDEAQASLAGSACLDTCKEELKARKKIQMINHPPAGQAHNNNHQPGGL